MRDQFVGDVNDFGKYGLLRRLCGVTREGDDNEHDPDLKLGVVWYYLTGKTKGGENTDYPNLAHCDPTLYPKLRGLLSPPINRTVANVEKLNFLHVEGRYYREINPNWGAPNNKKTEHGNRLAAAEGWLAGAIERVKGADIVFLDPDHKITGDKTRIGANSPMFVHVCEIKKLWKLGHSLVIYHQTNNASGMVCRAIELVREAVPNAAIDALHFNKAGQRLVFFVLSQDKHEAQIRERIDAMLGGAWVKHFELLHREPAVGDIPQAAD